ncbi:MAG: Mur ligase family protein [Patescibacteria group bacterium]
MIRFDSRDVKKGDIFVAIKGLHHDGNDFINDAKKRGASKIYSGKEKLGELASEFYGNPSSKLEVIGITGTKGKTTTCHLIHHILTKLGHKTGLISSITAQGFHTTTPDVVTLNKELSEMVKKGFEYAVIEVSSHGIDQGRVAGVKFEVAALTNIAPEHLDYHETYAEYKKTKLSFLKTAKTSVIAAKNTKIDVLPGIFNNLNAQLAVDVVAKLEIDEKDALKALYSFKLPEGRLEEVINDLGFKIYIDFAHTPESLENVLTYLRTQTLGKLISVFGCAGERDPRKRPKMGKISTQIADLSVFTAEDSRSEDIFDIFREMEKNAVKNKFVSVPERGEAIAYALSIAKKGDVVGVFGKGHEKSMAYGNFEHPWSDKETIRGLVDSLKNTSAIILAAGRGSRMKDSRSKVLREICGRPMLSYTLENLRKIGIHDLVVTVGFRKNLVINRYKGMIQFAKQQNPKGGTADAAKIGLTKIAKSTKVLIIINGDDSAFYRLKTVKNILYIHNVRDRKLTFVSLIKNDPTGLGRVVRGKNGLITKIVEEKDATEKERKIKEVNDGLYVFDRLWFEKNITKVKKGPQGEYYLVDLIKLAIDQGDRMATYTLPNDDEWHGINTPEQLIEAQMKMELRLNEKV